MLDDKLGEFLHGCLKAVKSAVDAFKFFYVERFVTFHERPPYALFQPPAAVSAGASPVPERET
jgi:hypothetical protein